MFSIDYGPPTLQRDFAAWRETFLSIAIRCNPQHAGTDFVGWAHTSNGFGFQATDVGFNLLERTERTQRDARVDGIDDFRALILVAGSATVSQNEHIVQMAAGDVILNDTTRPMITHYEGPARWFGLHLPRQMLVSHLGFEPIGGQRAQGVPLAGRLLHEMALSGLQGEDSLSLPADAYLQLAVYDLVGALFAQEAWPSLRPTDKLFNRLCRIIDSNFTDPDFGPPELAAEARISLRYVHKLFSERGTACSNYLYTCRLDHAARLLRRRASLRTGQRLCEIANACGFRNQAHFARKFHHRFGTTPRGYIAPLTPDSGTLADRD
jgi:AraC family transcriptional regulator, positive regulator of tynA and feaB